MVVDSVFCHDLRYTVGTALTSFSILPMLQDFPTVLVGAEASKVGFTSLASDLCFSPVKNATSDGVALQANGTHPGVAATGEADQNGATRQLLRSIGCDVKEGNKVKFSGIEIVSGPDCVLKPSFAACTNEYKKKFTNPSAVKISGRSSLVLRGEGLVIESLDLDGALVIECEEGASGVIRNLTVKNKGWVKLSAETSTDEVIRMRGYNMIKLETETVVFKKDGSIEGNYAPPGSTPKKATPAKAQSTQVKPQSVEKTAPIPVQPTLDLSKPASSEEKESDTFCGGGCSIM